MYQHTHLGGVKRNVYSLNNFVQSTPPLYTLDSVSILVSINVCYFLSCVLFCQERCVCVFWQPLRVEFLLKTESGYLRDAEVIWFTLASLQHSLRFNTHWSAPPVSALARFGGPRKMSRSPVSRNSNIERRMDRPKSVVGVIRGVA